MHNGSMGDVYVSLHYMHLYSPDGAILTAHLNYTARTTIRM